MINEKNYFTSEAKKLGIELSKEQLDKFSRYFDLVIENNKLFNLTAITEEHDFIDKHYIDSMIGVSEIPNDSNLLDIGSGGGFPSIPIAILKEDVKVTALDSTAKKMTFVENSAKEIGLNNITTIAGRAEEMPSLRESFDVVTARAVSSLPILLELAIPLLKVNGLFVAYKTDESELNDAKTALKTLNCVHISTKTANLPNGDNRAILVFKKLSKTDNKYPRQYGAIKKKPL